MSATDHGGISDGVSVSVNGDEAEPDAGVKGPDPAQWPVETREVETDPTSGG
jgi:hypothetical protein